VSPGAITDATTRRRSTGRDWSGVRIAVGLKEDTDDVENIEET